MPLPDLVDSPNGTPLELPTPPSSQLPPPPPNVIHDVISASPPRAAPQGPQPQAKATFSVTYPPGQMPSMAPGNPGGNGQHGQHRYSGGTGGSGWKLDYLAFLPIDNGFVRAEMGKAADNGSQVGLVVDTISETPGYYKISEAGAGAIDYPFVSASAPLAESYDEDLITLRARVDNRLTVLSNPYANSGNNVHKIAGVDLVIRYRGKMLR